MDWHSKQNEVLRFAVHLVEINDFLTPEELLYFFEKPWKWDSEYKEWNENGKRISPKN